MSNDLLTPPDTTAKASAGERPIDDHTQLLPQGVEGNLWTSLFSNLRDTFRPAKLPPLELTSQPVAVVDPFAVQRSPRSTAFSLGLHAVLILLFILLLIYWKKQPQVKQAAVKPIDISAFVPVTPPAPKVSGGGGGGGAHQITPPTKGKLPEFSKQPVTPPQILKVDHPKLPEPAAIKMPDVKMPDANMPNLGIPQANQVTLSAGNGGGSGIGQGHGGGLGSGNGNGLGPGSGGDFGGGLEHVGNGVSAPKVIYSVEPEFSDEARRQKYQGIVMIQLIVDRQGNPQNVRVVRSLGMGLDEKAIEAAKQYKFKPALKNGQPVPVMINLEINFQLY